MNNGARTAALLGGPVRVVNLGLEGFARDLAANGAQVVQVDWIPPAAGKPELLAALTQITSFQDLIDNANREALGRILGAEPVLADVRRAGELIPELDAERLVLHAGPPLGWERMCGPLKGAACGAIVFERWAGDLAAAEKLAASGAVKFAPNHHFGAVGPMTGITTKSMPLLVVENRAFGNRALCTINEGLGKVMRFGGNDAEVLARLAWLRDEFAPLLGAALRAVKGIPLNPLIARGLAMGDEMHQRNVACTSLLLRSIASGLARATASQESLAKAFEFIAGNDQFFLNVAMAMGKSILDPARGIEASTIVTAMARNGTDFGIRVAGLGEHWFTAPVEMPQGLYFPGFSAADANPDIGDSAILEAVGLGAFAMAAAPAVAGFVGAGGFREALGFTRAMNEITAARNPKWGIPALEFAGAPAGIDLRRVVETGIAPAINTGIAHRLPGIGQVGAGVARRRWRVLRRRFSPFRMSFTANRVEKGRYLDSVALMRVSRRLSELPGVQGAALMIGSPSNKALLRDAGLLGAEGEQATANDLIIAVRASDERSARSALDSALQLLLQKSITDERLPHARTLAGALELLPQANLALISVPGEFAALEARKALERGLHALVFSGNVPIEDEVALKLLANRKGLLLMGPDCGTALIAGTPVAFANAVPRGDIGVVSASGTGLQEVSCLIARLGGGVSHGIGVGGRDLDARVGGLGTLAAFDVLEQDANTRTIVLISKPPAPEVTNRVLERIRRCAKPSVVCFLGLDKPGVARTLRDAAEMATGSRIEEENCEIETNVKGRLVRGLYCGGTLCSEAELIFRRQGLEQHRFVDLGDDSYTRGRPHPMIEPEIRNDHVTAALADPAVGVVLVDIVLGYGSHPDPAGVLAKKNLSSKIVVASVIGTEQDPQVRSRQVALLRAAGVLVAPSNAHAAELAASLVA